MRSAVVLSSAVLLLAAASSVIAAPQTAPEAQQTSEDLRLGGSGVQSLEELGRLFNSWLRPVRTFLQERVQNRTVSEVVQEARNATVDLAGRVRDSDLFQSTQDALTPIQEMFTRVRDNVKDKTLRELADDVQRRAQELDRTIADFIRGLGAENATVPDQSAADAASGEP